MSVKSEQAVVAEFVISDATGAASNADALPTAVLTVNGVDNAAVVTVANKATGEYTASVVLPALSAGDVAAIIASATIDTVAAKGKVWEEVADTKRVSDLNDIAAGAAMTLTAAYDAAKTAATQASVNDLPTNAELAVALAAADDAVLLALAALNDLSSADAQAAAAAALAAIMEEDMVDETAIALAITTALGSLSVTVASPVGSGGTITIHAGDDYLDAEGRAIAFTVADATHTYLLDDGTAVVKFKSAQATWTATSISSTAGGYIVKFEPDADDTAALTYKQAYEVEATLTSTSVVTLCTGNLVVVRDIPAGA